MLKCYQGQLQRGSESKSADIYQSNSLTIEIFFYLQIGNFFFFLGGGGELGKKVGYFGLGMGPNIGPW